MKLRNQQWKKKRDKKYIETKQHATAIPMDQLGN